VYLEDREANTFRSLTDGDLKITLNEDVNGTGKYYLQLSSKSLSADTTALETISVYVSGSKNLKIVGLSSKKTSLKLFTSIGKLVFDTSFSSDETQNISLSNLSSGFYIVQIESVDKKLNKKIILE
jgi:hypothetical protein